ncbi:uncharacterized protein LOC111054809 [Nilaparvata lugens]|uniref:uncharacterized protein LOC111054809 n=1 Tax=Nilaparvata lugens TaxID=108931 RepID=UPI000B989702|nr:uncharacterized protein LOC111054809 [Nilaparvata lugens]
MDGKPPFISAFIELYRAYPCLWKVKDDTYSNKRSRDEAYGELLKFYKKTVPSATIDTVKKKINNLRCAFRKELKKVKQPKSGSSGDDAYTPSLWYFDLLLFTADHEETRATIGSDESQLESQDETSNHTSSQLVSPPSSVSNLSWTDNISSGPSTSSGNPKKSGNHKKRKDAIDAAVKALKEDDEFDGIGLNVACKLRRMDEDQKLYAEMLINKVLMYGVKGKLQEETDVRGLKFVQPQTPVRRVEKNISYSFGQDQNLQTTNNFSPITGEGSTGIPEVKEYFESAHADSDNQLSEFILLH